MTTQITPSKQVHLPLASSTRPREVHLINGYAQAAASLESLKVKDSPIKKLNFNTEDKENMPVASETTESPESITKPEVEIEKIQSQKAQSKSSNRKCQRPSRS